jgi:hypothetical protein
MLREYQPAHPGEIPADFPSLRTAITDFEWRLSGPKKRFVGGIVLACIWGNLANLHDKGE